MENDAFKCPKEGCGKNFRKENLLQVSNIEVLWNKSVFCSVCHYAFHVAETTDRCFVRDLCSSELLHSIWW